MRRRTTALPDPSSIIRYVPGPDNAASSVTQLTACLNSSTFSSALVNWKYIKHGFRKVKHVLKYFAKLQCRAARRQSCAAPRGARRAQPPQVRALSYHRALARSKGAAGHGSDISTRAEHKPSCVSHTMLYGLQVALPQEQPLAFGLTSTSEARRAKK